jgi:hypothetical protein
MRSYSNVSRLSNLVVVFALLMAIIISAVWSSTPVVNAAAIPTDWSVPMTATAGTEGSNPNLEFGTRLGATDTYNASIDIPSPPLGPGQTLSSYFSITHFLFPQLNKDFRAPMNPGDTRQWTDRKSVV